MSDLEAAQSLTTPADALILLATAADPNVRQAAQANPNCPEALRELLRIADTTPQFLLAVHLDILAGLGPHARGIAERHPKCPPAVKARLQGEAAPVPAAEPGPPSLRDRLRRRAADPDLSDEDRALIHQDRRLQSLAARHPLLPVDLLVQLDELKPYGQARETLLERLGRHPLDPEILLWFAWKGSWEERAAVARNPALPGAARDALCRDEDWWVRAAAAENPAATPADLTELAQDDEHVTIREHVAAHPHTPGDVLARLAADGESEVRVQVARNPSAPPEALEWLAADHRFGIREAVAAHALCPPHVLDQLAGDPNDRVSFVARLRRRPPTDAAVAAALATRRRHVKLALGTVQEVSEAVVAQLARDRNPQVRAQVALHPKLPSGTRRALTQDPVGSVRAVARAADDSTPPDQLAFLPRFDARVRQALSRNRQAPAPVLDDLSEDPLLDVRLNVVLNPASPGSALQRRLGEQPLRPDLRRHPRYEQDLRDRLQHMEYEEAGAQDAAPEALHLLSQSDSPKVRRRVAGRPQTGEDTLLGLAADPDAQIRLVLTRRDALPAGVQLALAADSSAEIREALVQRDDLTVPAMLHLVERAGEDEAILVALAQHQNVTPAVLTALARHPVAGARQAAAKHRETPTTLLMALADDLQGHVRRALLKNEHCPPEVLLKLVGDPDLRLLLVSHPQVTAAVLEALTYDAGYARLMRTLRWLDPLPLADAEPVRRWRRWARAQASSRARGHLNVFIAVIDHERATPRAVLFARRLNHVEIDAAHRRRLDRQQAKVREDTP